MSETEIRLPDPSKLIVSSSPHIHKGRNVTWIMLMVIVALLPAVVAGFLAFGWRAIFPLTICIASCLVFESIFAKLRGRVSPIGDLSAVVTGLLLGMNMPAPAEGLALPCLVYVIASFFGIVIGKAIFGGLGYNPFNPALVGRVAVFVGFSGVMTKWMPTQFMGIDAITQATPLGKLSESGWLSGGQEALSYGQDGMLSMMDLFLGNVGGCVGETSALALLIGGIFLIALKLIRWQIPVAFLGTIAVVSGILNWHNPVIYAPPLFHLLTGGAMLGAFFMATDMVTSPASRLGAVIFGAGCGLITILIRTWGAYPEGVSFAILIMNTLVPLIDRYTLPKPFGAVRTVQEANG